jgi:hypothetical protein
MTWLGYQPVLATHTAKIILLKKKNHTAKKLNNLALTRKIQRE